MMQELTDTPLLRPSDKTIKDMCLDIKFNAKKSAISIGAFNRAKQLASLIHLAGCPCKYQPYYQTHA